MTVVCKEMFRPAIRIMTRFGVLEDGRGFQALRRRNFRREADGSQMPILVSCGIYVSPTQDQLIELIEKSCGGRIGTILSRDVLDPLQGCQTHLRIQDGLLTGAVSHRWMSYYQTNMDFLKPEVREHFFRTSTRTYIPRCRIFRPPNIMPELRGERTVWCPADPS